jgi:hypothetical protein
LTYGLLRPVKDDEKLAPRIQSDYKIQHADVVESLRSAQKRKQRRVKRTITVLIGWAVMGAMVYLILVTQRTTPEIWNPYDILGVAEVRITLPHAAQRKGVRDHANLLPPPSSVLHGEADQVTLPKAVEDDASG